MKQSESSLLILILLCFCGSSAVVASVQRQGSERRRYLRQLTVDCTIFSNSSECVATTGCRWKASKNKCAPLNCTNKTTKRKCKKVTGCVWSSGKCTIKSDAPKECSTIGKKRNCKNKSHCFWSSGSCQTKPETPPTTASPPEATTQSPPSTMQARLAEALATCPSTGAQASVCQAFLSRHNTERWNIHVQYLADMGDTSRGPSLLKWDATLAASAQSHANKLAADCATHDMHSSGARNGLFGENVAAHGSTVFDDNGLVDFIFSRWWTEEKQWAEAGTISSTQFIGHFTQIAWYESFSMACATAQASCSTGVKHYQVCQYYHPGNCNVGDWSNWKADIMDSPHACAKRERTPPV